MAAMELGLCRRAGVGIECRIVGLQVQLGYYGHYGRYRTRVGW